MSVHALHGEGTATRQALLHALDDAMSELAQFAIDDDVTSCFPSTAMARLRAAGLLTAVLPTEEGGAGLGVERHATGTLLQVLTRLGGVHLSLARLFEGHVNAFALLWQYGTPAQRRRVTCYVREGGLLGVWNAPVPHAPLRLVPEGAHYRLHGSKVYASGAGAIRRPLLTAMTAEGALVMLWSDVSAARVDLSAWRVHGMRSTATGTVHLDDVMVAADELFGSDQDYHRQPAFSGGAWRFVAAQLGAAGALVDALRQSLLSSQRDGDPHQRARLAEAAMRLETGRLWTDAAAHRAEDPGTAAEDIVAYVGMARLVVEDAAMAVIALVQRSIGLRALHEAHPAERIARDLATYLRQPVPDAIRDAAAQAALQARGALLERWR